MKYYPIQKKKFKSGEMIFSEDSEGDGMYIIDAGRVRVFKTVWAGDTKKEIELCTLGPKAMFGEMAMIDDHPRSASVQAIVPTTCTVITRKVFEEQLRFIPVWMVNMIKILVMRLRETNDKLRTIIEQYGAVPQDDTGRVITVDEDAIAGRGKLPQEGGALAHQGGRKRHYKSEDIVKDLFD
jgi:CRP/FNR family transcriptional regulator, cyclic AMP receptor protein